MTVIDTYLDDVNPEQKQELERIRNIVKQAVPGVEEVISYGMPAFKYKQKIILYFAAFKNHMSIFPTGDQAVDAIGDELTKFKTSKGTYQFTKEVPIPELVIKKLIEVRLKSITTRT